MILNGEQWFIWDAMLFGNGLNRGDEQVNIFLCNVDMSGHNDAFLGAFLNIDPHDVKDFGQFMSSHPFKFDNCLGWVWLEASELPNINRG